MNTYKTSRFDYIYFSHLNPDLNLDAKSAEKWDRFSKSIFWSYHKNKCGKQGAL